jgi:hypothetical protein
MPPEATIWVVAMVPQPPETLKFTVFAAVAIRASAASHTLAVINDVEVPLLYIAVG